jgi:hypothetical protein
MKTKLDQAVALLTRAERSGRIDWWSVTKLAGRRTSEVFVETSGLRVYVHRVDAHRGAKEALAKAKVKS